MTGFVACTRHALDRLRARRIDPALVLLALDQPVWRTFPDAYRRGRVLHERRLPPIPGRGMPAALRVVVRSDGRLITAVWEGLPGGGPPPA